MLVLLAAGLAVLFLFFCPAVGRTPGRVEQA